MFHLAKSALAAAAFCGLLFTAPASTQAFELAVKSLPRVHTTVLERRECIAWERDENGTLRCTNWAECTADVC